MLHCPFCGAIVKNNEQYCVSCGDELPDDLMDRHHSDRKKFNFFWLIPIASMLIMCTAVSIYYIILQHKTNEAIELYENGIKDIQASNFKEAKQSFEKALDLKENFYEADISLSFINHTLDINDNLKEAAIFQENSDFEEALLLTNEAESSLNNFHGEPVTELINEILILRNSIKIDEVQYHLNSEPNIDDLKSLLWETEAINNDESMEIAESIRTKIVDFIFSKASEQLNNNQFSDAQILVEDGLKYVADSEKLLSLKTTIDKEKTAFETAQQERIEQAINMAAEEHEVNQSDAVKLNSVKLKKDDQKKLVVKGEVNSIATIPIHSVVIEYALITNKDEEILSNKVFIYPDKLYPNETGKFEYTHYEIDDLKEKDIKVKVNKITWYTD